MKHQYRRWLGSSTINLKRISGLPTVSLAVISRREKPLIEATRGHLQGLLGHASKLALERLIDKLDKDEIPPAVLPVCAGILVDKVRAGEGDAVTVIETRKTATLDDVKALIRCSKST